MQFWMQPSFLSVKYLKCTFHIWNFQCEHTNRTIYTTKRHRIVRKYALFVHLLTVNCFLTKNPAIITLCTFYSLKITDLKKYFRASSYSDCGNGPAEEGKGFDRTIRQTHAVTHIQKLQTMTLSAKHLHRNKIMAHELFQKQ